MADDGEFNDVWVLENLIGARLGGCSPEKRVKVRPQAVHSQEGETQVLKQRHTERITKAG